MAATTPPPPTDLPPPGPPMDPPGGSPPPAATATLPWEDPSRPLFDAFVETLKLFFTAPSEGFSRMPLAGNLGRPIMYLIIVGWAGTIFGQLYSIALGGLQLPFLEEMGGMEGMEGFGAFGMSVGMSIGIMVIAPVLVLIGAFIQAGIIHLMLMLLGAANSGFEATLRVACYAATVQLLQIVPFCGGLIALVWGIVLWVFGLAIAHNTTQGKALIAILLPIVLCCVCIIVVAFGMGGLGAFLASQQ